MGLRRRAPDQHRHRRGHDASEPGQKKCFDVAVRLHAQYAGAKGRHGCAELVTRADPAVHQRAAFQAVVDAGYADLVRPHQPGADVYTYLDYYRQRFERNRGMRIDFILGSPALAARVTGAWIDRDERGGQGASDHAPVIVDLSD